MDLARAIHKIDPKARFLLNHSVANGMQIIVEWRAPGPQPTDTMLRDAWALCQDDDIDEMEQEQERQIALIRVKEQPSLADLVTVLRL